MERRDVIKRVSDQGKARYYYQGNFTIAIVTWGGLEGVGVAKCNVNEDKYDQTVGQRQAFNRAARAIAEQIEDDLAHYTYRLRVGEGVEIVTADRDGKPCILRVAAVPGGPQWTSQST